MDECQVVVVDVDGLVLLCWDILVWMIFGDWWMLIWMLVDVWMCTRS